MDVKREVVRHLLATVAYRGAKAIREAPADFHAFRPGPESWTAGAIVAHIGDLFEWALSMAKGAETRPEAAPPGWDDRVDRLFRALAAFDAFLASDQPVNCSLERLLQGPIADALTHIGQLAMLRRLAGAPIGGESYVKADVVIGRIGLDQSAPRSALS
jgi:DinB family protein